jgi:hypothetical protein
LVGPREQQPVQRVSTVQRKRAHVVRRQLGDPGARGASALQSLAAERFWPPTGRVAELALQEPDDRVGYVVGLRVGLEVGRVGAPADQCQREVADDLAARGDLDDVAEDPVGRGVGVFDGLELLAQTERDGLLTQVRQLPAGDLVVIDPAGRRGDPDSNGA